MSLNLGLNPVDPELSFRAAIESSLDVMSSINECAENSRDYAKNVNITLIGDPIPDKPGVLNLTSVVIDDDGIGMDFAVMYEKFRGAYFDSSSHLSSIQSGRNGIGVKTNLQYWKEIHVETTTKGLIPSVDQWKCTEKNRPEIEKIYRAVSKLSSGDPDTELRAMILRVKDADLLEFKTVSRDDSGTKVTLKEPRLKIEFNVEEFIKRQGHCIEWLMNPDHILTISYKGEQGRLVKKIVRPFYEMDGKDKFICHVKGNSKEDLHIIYHDSKATKQTVIIPANTNPSLGSIDIDLKILDRDPDAKNPNDFVVSICGANIYDRLTKRNNSIPPSVEYFLGQGHFKSSSGFSYRIHGFIRTNDERLKKSLRHNKSVLDEEDRYSRAFVDYIVTDLLKPLNKIYAESLETQGDKEDKDVLNEISQEFNTIMRRVDEKQKQIRKEREKPVDPTIIRHKEYKCNDCGTVWKVLLDKNPSYCAEFNVDKDIKGCGSRDIERNVHAKNDLGPKNIQFKWTKPFGGFLPARYEPEENCILLVSDHPSFITTLPGNRARTHRITVGIEKAFFAIAAYKSEKEDKAVMEVYGELLREWFENKSNRDPHKVQCRKVWRESGITIDQI